MKMNTTTDYQLHGFSPSEGWDDDYYSEDFSENWQKYVKEE